MEQMSKTPAHDAPETLHIIVEPMELTGKGDGAAYDWRREPPGEPTEREKKSPGAGSAEGNGSEGENRYAHIVAQNAGIVKPKTRREIILSALDAMGEAAETAGFFINAYANGAISVQFYAGRDALDAMAARPGVEVAFRLMSEFKTLTFRRSVIIGGVEYFDFMSAKEAARHGIL